ncbi:NuA4 histone acetyltransferase subunit [Sorochytrium milnesiophthora]
MPDAVFPTHYGVQRSQDTEMVDATVNGTTNGGGAASPSRKLYIGDCNATIWRPNMDIVSPLAGDGTVADMDALEDVWQYTFKSRLRVNPQEHPLLVTETSWNTREIREQLVELALEKFDFPAFFVVKNAVLASFSAGKSSAFVVESGATTTSVVPVHDGYVLRKGIVKQHFAGNALAEQTLLAFKSAGIELTPLYQIAKRMPTALGERGNPVLRQLSGTTESFHNFATWNMMNDFKESCLQICETPLLPNTLIHPKLYEFPDGYYNNFGLERYRIPEALFKPAGNVLPSPSLVGNSAEYKGVAQLAEASLANIDPDPKALLLGNVVVTGGTTLIPGFAERLNNELSAVIASVRVKVHASGQSSERKFGNWLGGSILASLGTFHQMWISKREYEETGKSIVEKKCM